MFSQGELDFMRQLVALGVRPDGRGCLQSRPLTFEKFLLPGSLSSVKTMVGQIPFYVSLKVQVVSLSQHQSQIQVKLCSSTQQDQKLQAQLQFLLSEYLLEAKLKECFELASEQFMLKWYLDITSTGVFQLSMVQSLAQTLRHCLQTASLPEFSVVKNLITGQQSVDCNGVLKVNPLTQKLGRLLVLAFFGNKIIADPTQLQAQAADCVILVCRRTGLQNYQLLRGGTRIEWVTRALQIAQQQACE